MYSIYKKQDKININISDDLPLSYFPHIENIAYFEADVPRKFLLFAKNKTRFLNQADVHITSTKTSEHKNDRVLFCANHADLIKYTKMYDSKYEICPVNTLKFEPIDFTMPNDPVKKILFSSKRAFDFFVAKAGLRYLCDKEILAIGKKSALYIEQHGFRVRYPEIYRASELSLEDTLVVCPKEHASYGNKAVILNVYQTKMSDDVSYYTYDNDFDYAIISSPSSVKFLLEAGFDYLDRIRRKIICIGSTTEKAVVNFGYSCIIPSEFTIDGLFEKLEALS